MSVKTNQKNFPIREAAVATSATKDEFQDARFIGPNYPSPCSDMVIATQTAVVRAVSSSTRTLKFIPLEHTVEDVQALCHLPKLQHPQVSQRGAGEGSFRRGTTLQVQPISVSSRSTQRRPAGAMVVFSSAGPPRRSPIWLAPRPRACPSLELEMPCVRISRFLRFSGLAEEGTHVTVLLELGHSLVCGSHFRVDVAGFQGGFEPGMEQDLGSRESLGGLPSQEAANEAPGFGGNVLWNAELSTSDFGEEGAGV